MPTQGSAATPGERLSLLLILVLAAALRFPALDRIPNGLIPDEALAGYDAYSILETGRDQFGERLPVFPKSVARSHSLHIYLSVPSVALMGLNEWAVRLPAALAGLATVLLTYLWLRDTQGRTPALCAALLVAISPWHVLLSRTGCEWVLLPALLLATLWLAARALSGRGGWLWPGVVAGLSMYSYAPVRLLLPLMLVGFAIFFLKELRNARRSVMGGVLAFLLVAVPAGLSQLREGALDRLQAVRVRGTAGEIAGDALRRYLASFSVDFLLRPAREGELHRLRSTGLLHVFEPGLMLVGAAAVLRRRDRWGLYLLAWCLAAPAVVLVHREAPDPILDVASLPADLALEGLGAGWLLAALPPIRRGLWPALALAAVAPSVARSAHDLYTSFPVDGARAWSHGARQMVAEIEKRRSSYDGVLVDGREKWIFSLILFYARYDPSLRQRETRELAGAGYRARVGPYRIGRLQELLGQQGRFLVWARAPGGRQLFRGQAPLLAVPLPDGTPNHLLYERVSAAP